MPDEQILLSPSGEVLYSPTKTDASTIAVPASERPRFFLLSSVELSAKGQEMAGDWIQICTKSTFGCVPVVQPAFRKITHAGGDPLATLICAPCARTCTTGTAFGCDWLLGGLVDSLINVLLLLGSGFQPVKPMEWSASKELASRFISEVAVVAGDVNVPAPSGFTKLPGDLNYSASGDYVYLCVKRGGPRALTQLHVLFKQLGDQNSSDATASIEKGAYSPEKVVDTDCNSGGAAGDGSGTCVRIGYDSVQLMGNTEQLDTLAITDIAVVAGNEPYSSPDYVKVSRNLNEGTSGAQTIFLWYRLAPLGGFVCDSSREHSEFGECLFTTRHLNGVKSLLDLDEQKLGFAQTALATARKRGDEAIMDARYRQHQSGMLGRLQGGLKRAQSYESKQMQEEALKRIPVDKLHERARANQSPMPSYEDELVKQLLHWFKKEFFTWMNQPRCSACNHNKTRSIRTEGPSTAEEFAGQASRVEVYQCPQCGAFTRFPRYNDPVKLLDTRTGRCGEWANCFTLCCRAMGFEARYVLDVTDHVWTEVYSEHFKRWLHCDSCEDQLDCPLTYEVGWGKKLSYIFSFAHDEVVDTARRYTQNWAEMYSRRRDVSEMWLKSTISQINRGLWERQTPERIAILTTRAKVEQEELLRGRSVQKTEVQGRVSGSAEWKSQRNEDGKHENSSLSDSTASSLRGAMNAVPTVNILQTLCKNLVVGCQSPQCSNPFCFTGRTDLGFSDLSSDVNERAAQALQLVTDLSSNGFSSDALAMLECTNKNDIRSFLWKNKPLVYLPLQDSPSADGRALLIDISGHGNHVENSKRCALRKPFRIPNTSNGIDTNAAAQITSKTFGMQLIGGKTIPIAIKGGISLAGFILTFLVRLDKDDSLKTKRSDVVGVLGGELKASNSAISVIFRIGWNCADQRLFCELQHLNDPPRTEYTSSPLISGQYAHVAIVRDEATVGLYVNGAKTVETKMDQFRVDSIILEGIAHGSTNVASVISHVAVIPAKSPDDVMAFCATMIKDFVASPPLRAFGVSGEPDDKRCVEDVAEAQSGYRVAQVLSM
ncbi:unnamed protein product [Phytophthora fragariaefolia]|uniref:Unnamed protein product n=1 Tax=Phytophthora fragariaefolia TaxID=1490495 RepID=A0A9W6XYQ0_9STRA|nr:unnamed protein product [Phytophthora fragariaefolia]